MFKRSILVTPLTNEDANNYFENVTGEAYGSDTSFLASMRALVTPRMPEKDNIYLKIGRSSYTAANFSGCSKEGIINAICGGLLFDKGKINVCNICPREDEDVKVNFEMIKTHFISVYGGQWQLLDKIGVYYRTSFNIICFINPELKSVALFVDRLNLQKWHYLQMSILAFLPWYFDPKIGLTELEFELVQSLSEKDPAHYEECLNKIAKQYDFESGRIKKMLAGFEIKYEKMELDKVLRDINSIDRSIEDLNNKFASYNKQRVDLCIRQIGLEQKISSGDGSSEIMDYFLCNRKLRLVSVSGTTVKFTVKAALEYFDEEMAKKFIGNTDSYLYSHCNAVITKEKMKKLLTAIFLDQTLSINTCAYFEFSIGGSIHAPDGHDFENEMCDDYMPNPHMYFHSCLGNYQRAINNRILANDYIGAIEQCVASAKSLNFGDSAVASKFARELITGNNINNHCIVLPNGNVVNAKEAIKWLDEKNATKASDGPADNGQGDVAVRADVVPDDPF